MDFSSIEAVEYAFAFLIPGYIMEVVINSFVPLKREEEKFRFIRCLMYSIINYIIWASWGIRLLQKWLKPEDYLFWIIVAVAVIISGCLTGFAIGIIKSKDFVPKILNKMLIKIKVQISGAKPSAWEDKFSRMDLKSGCWMLITAKNGKCYAGWYGADSYAGSEYAIKDIYLERTYEYSEDKEW